MACRIQSPGNPAGDEHRVTVVVRVGDPAAFVARSRVPKLAVVSPLCREKLSSASPGNATDRLLIRLCKSSKWIPHFPKLNTVVVRAFPLQIPEDDTDRRLSLLCKTPNGTESPSSRGLGVHMSKSLDDILPLLDLFNEVEFQTTCGQMIDLITMLEGEKDLSKYSLPIHRRIVQYKTAYYSFYLPVACALLMFGENLDDHAEVKNILVEMGIYFQVQDDYLDCFGDPEVIGKIGTDIEDFKCSWLVVKALERCNEEQKKLLRENYGKADQANVAKVKELYKELDIEGAFLEYESSSYKKLTSAIEAQPSKAVQAVLKSFLGKIYKRKK
ncbi:farnesyl pyrophosphate synthase 2-like [Malania oleifera]|uniref:farnesyl pyrophosphate synthase 2-like n=1 Tax=Malania oleifera TaxID=397392 RepID=UPI0025AE5710|nr:farnesyl pyrophosphate synthase 2-like [Malania oleifera]